MAEDDKTASKTAISTLNGSVIPLGAHPGNTGGKKGRSGRKPAPFKAMLARIRESPELAASIEKAVADHESRAFPAVLKLMADYDPERPAPPKQEMVGELLVRVVRDQPPQLPASDEPLQLLAVTVKRDGE